MEWSEHTWEGSRRVSRARACTPAFTFNGLAPHVRTEEGTDRPVSGSSDQCLITRTLAHTSACMHGHASYRYMHACSYIPSGAVVYYVEYTIS